MVPLQSHLVGDERDVYSASRPLPPQRYTNLHTSRALNCLGSDGLALSTSYSFIATVCPSLTAHSVLEVGLGEIDSSLGATSPKNQVAGLLQAVQYMKGVQS